MSQTKLYIVKQEQNDFMVIEQKYDLIIARCKTKKEANKIRNRLNSGCGFMGHTPPFFVSKQKKG